MSKHRSKLIVAIVLLLIIMILSFYRVETDVKALNARQSILLQRIDVLNKAHKANKKAIQDIIASRSASPFNNMQEHMYSQPLPIPFPQPSLVLPGSYTYSHPVYKQPTIETWIEEVNCIGKKKYN